jgi:anion-transporting  ArsA/GET3 family ATPase
VRRLLAQPTTGFVLVASPSPLSIDEALGFHERLRAERMPVAGLVVNRVAPDLWEAERPLPGQPELEAALGSDAGLAARLATTLAEHQRQALGDARALERLFAAAQVPRAVVPRLERDVHDLAGLALLAERL